MAKNLAVTFSLTGLGPLRVRGKKSFRDHPISKVVVESLRHHHPQTPTTDLISVCGAVLRGAPDWNGGRANRRHLPVLQE